MDEPVKQTDPVKDPKYGNLPGPGVGRIKGSKNKFTKLKDEILNAVNGAAKISGYKDKDGKPASQQYLDWIFTSKPMDFLKIATGIMPKDLHVTGEITLAGALLELDRQGDGDTGQDED